MTKVFKLFVRFTFFTLMMAVALRPVVVTAITTGSFPESQSGALHGPSASTAFSSETGVLSRPHSHASPNLKVIPKETVEVETLIPRFSISCLPADGSFQTNTAAIGGVLSQSRPLVLRI